MSKVSPDQLIAIVENRATRRETPCGDGQMIWRHWTASGPVKSRPLVLLHGGSGSWLHWLCNIEAFARDREVWAPDLPGFGDSARPPEPINFASVARIVSAGLREVIPGDGQFDLVGFSFGSHTSQYVANELGNRVRTVVLVTGHMLGPMTAQPSTILERWRTIEDPVERDSILKRNLGALMLAHEASMDPLALHLYANDVLRARIRPVKFINDRDFTMIERLPCRVVGIAGELDPLGMPSVAAQGEQLLRQRPDAQFHVIRNAGHWVAYEASDSFNALVREALDG